MRKTHTSSAVKNAYNKRAYDQFLITVPKGEKEVISSHASSLGLSTNAFVRSAIEEKIERLNK